VPAVEVTISASDTTVSPSQPVTLTVKATNRGKSRVLLGVGSSTCQVNAIVLVNSNWEVAQTMQFCTADIVEQWLNPGETRSESWPWLGAIIKPGATEALPPGRYLIKGRSDNFVGRRAIAIEVVEE